MSIFTQLLVETLSGAAQAGLKSMQQGGSAPAPTPGKKKPGCSSCEALKEVERAKHRISKGKL
jgi:hypothetical protein